MSGRSIGLAAIMFAGVRVTGQLTYIPAHINAAGKRINAKVTIPVAKNSHKGTRPDGTKGRTDYFTLTAWGKLADIMCRSCPKGKALDALCEPRSYMGKLFDANGNVRLDSAGQPIEIPKMSFNIITSPVFGEESQKQIDLEIAERVRPANWNVPNHPDYAAWTQVLQARQAYSWDGQSPTFLFARVVIPQGVQLDFTQGQPQQTAPVQTQAAPNMQTMVQHAVSTAPATVPVNNVNTVAPAAPAAPAAGGNINQVI